MTRAVFVFALLLAAYRVGQWTQATDERQSRTLATCPNWDSVIVHATPWEREHGRRPRTLHPPEDCR